MYVPDLFAEARPEELHRLIREHSLGMLVTHTAAGLDANHLPFLIESQRGACGTLVAHVARANPVWTEVADDSEVLVVFRGAQGYISPNWYLSKHEHHRHVPTWNYEVVHAHGRIRWFDDERFVRGMVARLSRTHEAAQPRPWKIGDAPANYIAEELSAIVGVEIKITRLVGKRKLSQNREPHDFESTLAGLEGHGCPELAAAMRRTRLDPPT